MKEHYRLYIIPIILLLTFIYSLVRILSSNVIWTWKHYTGYSLFFISLILLFIDKKYHQYLLLLTLVLGTLGILSFTPTVYGFGLMGMEVDIFAFALLLLSFFLFYQKEGKTN